MGETNAKSTSTAKATWKNDCRKYCKAGIPFKVTGLSTDAQKKFVADFATKNSVAVAYGDDTAYFSPVVRDKARR